MNDIRYVLSIKDCRKLYKSIPFVKEEAIELPYDLNHIFVNILESKKDGYETYYRVKLFYADGETFEGWVSNSNMPIFILNDDNLFDGRFNA